MKSVKMPDLHFEYEGNDFMSLLTHYQDTVQMLIEKQLMAILMKLKEERKTGVDREADNANLLAIMYVFFCS